MDSTEVYNLPALKAMGLMKQKQADLFSIRLRVVGGHLTSAQLRVLADLAEQYAHGHIHLTTRQGVEIPNVRFRDWAKVQTGLARADLEFGACGTRVRTITACQGGLCLHGLIDPQSLARRLDAQVYGRADLPHKFKIGITGCPNGCIKPQENDLGVMGLARLHFDAARCTACGLCVQACPAPGALRLEEGVLLHDPARCLRCAACVAACPRGAWRQVGSEYAVFVGGKMGKRPQFGERLPFVVPTEESLVALVEATLEWYTTRGERGERFGDTLSRLGLTALSDYLRAALAEYLESAAGEVAPAARVERAT